MAGHSKWANIKRRKGAQDAKRGKIFTKLIKEISVATREGGPDVETNPRLRLAVQNAKGANMPKDNIDRAIKKSSGQDGTNYEAVTFEGYANHGVGVFVECLTDNNNRTVSDVRAAFSKFGSGLSKNGSLEFIFDRKGVFEIPKPEDFDEDEFQLELIDGGAEEVEVGDQHVTVYSAMEDFGSVQKKLEKLGIEAETAELQRIPNTSVDLDDDGFKNVMKLIEVLEDNDDVQKVYHNLAVKEGQEELI